VRPSSGIGRASSGRIAAITAIACLLACPRPGRAAVDVGPPKRIVFAEGRIWIVANDGHLWSVKPGDAAARHEAVATPTEDICVRDGAPLLATCGGENCGTYVFRGHVSGGWSTVASVDTGDTIWRMSCSHEAISLLTNRRVIQIVDGKIRRAGGGWQPRIGTHTSFLGRGDSAFIGIDAGEWGGGLLRVDMASGKPSTVQPDGSGCGDPLDAGCDPVHALEVSPWNPECIVAAVGLKHLRWHGRVVEVCGDRIETIYEATIKDRGTEPFYGLARAGNVLWAVGQTGMYRIERGSATVRREVPPLHSLGGIPISLEIPGLVVASGQLLGRSAHAGLAVGGGTFPVLLSR
jgi:hypothetical protein